jgi:hypothetical protein
MIKLLGSFASNKQFYENIYKPAVPKAQTYLSQENFSWADTQKIREKTKGITFQFPKTSMGDFVTDAQPFSYSRKANPEPPKSFLSSVEASKNERVSWIQKIEEFNKKFN